MITLNNQPLINTKSMHEKEVLLKGLKMAIDTNRYYIKGSDTVIVPAELAKRLYNLISLNHMYK